MTKGIGRGRTVVHVITRLIVGGAQQNTILTCASQVEAGQRVILAYGPIYGPEGSLLAEARQSGAELHEISSLRRSVHPWHDARALSELRRLVQRVRPDVVHTHSSKAGILGRAAAWAESVPCVVHTVHGVPFNIRQHALVNRGYVAIERWAARRCHRLIAITQAMVDAFDAAGIASPDRFDVVTSGVDLRTFRPRPEARERVRTEWGVPDDAVVVGLVARLDPLKGHDDLLAAYPQLRRRLRDHDVRLVFVGDGWEGNRLRAHPLAKSGHVVFAGLVPLAHMAAVYSAMDVSVLPSYQEGQSRTLVEALLCGVPVVAYGVGGTPEVCDGGAAGLLVPVGDVGALAVAIGDTISDPIRSRRRVDHGMVHVSERFSAAGMPQAIEEVYARVLGSTA